MTSTENPQDRDSGTSLPDDIRAGQWLQAAEEVARGDGGNLPGGDEARATWVLALAKLAELRMRLFEYEQRELNDMYTGYVDVLAEIRDALIHGRPR